MTDGRGQSSTLAIAIVFVLALTSALLIAGTASLTLDESRQVAETESGVQTMTELDSRASLVALEGGDSATIDVRSRAGKGRVSVDDGGEIRFVMRDNNSITWRENVTLGTVTYANGNRRIAYQGGGVWRSTTGSNGSVMVSPPEVHYRQGTLTLPMINVSGSDRGISTVRARKVSSKRVYPKGKNRSNPVPDGDELVIVVKSEYYRGWAAFFRDRIGGDVEVNDSESTVRVRLISKAPDFELGSGLISTGTSERIHLTGSGGNPSFVDSYNSSEDPYPTSASKNGTVRGGGGLKLSGNSWINGTVDNGGTVELDGSDTIVRGDVWHQGLVNSGGTITGETAENGSGVDIAPIDQTVTDRVNEICGSGAPAPSFASPNDEGDYCVSGDLVVPKDETLTFNLSGGGANISVTGDIILEKNATIEVVDPSGNTAKFWLGGSTIDMGKKGTDVFVPGQRSPALHIYGPSETTVIMRKDSTFVGLIFAPGEVGDSGLFELSSQAELFGSAVVGEIKMTSGAAVHYDQALEGFTFKRQGTPASHLSYLHVTINEVEFEER